MWPCGKNIRWQCVTNTVWAVLCQLCKQITRASPESVDQRLERLTLNESVKVNSKSVLFSNKFKNVPLVVLHVLTEPPLYAWRVSPLALLWFSAQISTSRLFEAKVVLPKSSSPGWQLCCWGAHQQLLVQENNSTRSPKCMLQDGHWSGCSVCDVAVRVWSCNFPLLIITTYTSRRRPPSFVCAEHPWPEKKEK